MDTTAYYEAYRTWAFRQEEAILTFFGPDRSWKRSPTQQWFGSDFSFVFLLGFAYIAFIALGLIFRQWLPKLNTRPLQFIYNPLQIVLCSYMAMEALIQCYRNGYTFFPCNSFNVEHPVIANVLWWFYMSKILDLLDTVFIVLNQKWSQLSFLHVYHHFTILLYYWLCIRVGYDGDIFLTIVLNGFIHVIMYTYYFISLHTRHIWWKPYLTAMQMIQFMLMEYQGYVLITTPTAAYPYRISFSYTLYVQTLFWLFFQFFVRSYMNKKPKLSSKPSSLPSQKKDE